ncbi:TPA: hypothetical protein ACH3X1_007172 [Trebouxia sp. C0004]
MVDHYLGHGKSHQDVGLAAESDDQILKDMESSTQEAEGGLDHQHQVQASRGLRSLTSPMRAIL